VKLDSKSHRTLFSATLVLLVLGLVVLPATAATYQEISAPNSDQTWASGINNLGQVVGYYEIPGTNIIEGFLLSSGVYTNIIFSGEPNTFATAINDSGLIAGFVQTQDIGSPYFGFTYQNGFKSLIKFPTAKSTQAFGINNAGQVVGTYVDLQNVSHGFLFSAGIYKSIDIVINKVDPKSTMATGINTAGDISGTFVDHSSQEHGFLLHANGTLTVINYRGALNGTVVGGINDHDQLAGYFTPPTTNRSTGFEWSAGTFTTLLYPSAVSTQPFGINNTQVVVGAWVTQQGNFEGFMETP
jgi:probable HAF family extracellular repeat protein